MRSCSMLLLAFLVLLLLCASCLCAAVSSGKRVELPSAAVLPSQFSSPSLLPPPSVNPLQLLTAWDATLRCPTPLTRNDAKRNATSACWWMEWLPMYAASLQPSMRGTPRMTGNWSASVSARMLQLQRSLALNDSCDSLPLVYPTSSFPSSPVKLRQQDFVQGLLSYSFYVDGTRGSDSSNGTDPAHAMQTLKAALAASRLRPQTSHATIFLRAGPHYLSSTLRIDSPLDSGLIITAMPGEDAVLIGGVPMNTTWTKTDTPSVFSSPIPAGVECTPSTFNEMFAGGVRWTPARWPDGDAFRSTVGDSWSQGVFSFAGESNYSAARTLTLKDVRHTLAFRSYRVGYNGSAAPFADEMNYWAADQPEGGAGATRTLPTHLTYHGALAARLSRWVNVSHTVVHALQRYGWGSWQFRVASVNASASSMALGEGGFQEARGCSASCAFAATGYFEYQFAELDRDGEFYVDWDSRVLYVYASQAAMLPKEVVASQVDTMLWLSGVSNVTVQGVTVMHSANSYMSLHAAPGGGDWATAVSAAIRVSSSHHCNLVNLLLTELAGNAIAVDGSSSFTRIAYNEISAIGANAVSVRGTMLSYNASTETTQPRDTLVQSNLCHDVGKYNKQAGCLFHSLAYRTVLDGNVMHTTPRSAVNIQDGFGGGTVISHNIILNSMAETIEGGPLNVWNRLPYWCPNLTHPEQGYTWEPNPIYVHHNLMVVDNAGRQYYQAFNYDDGTTAVTSSDNVVLQSRAGETNHGTQNFYFSNLIFPPAGISCWWVSTPTPLTVQSNNTCIVLERAPTYGVDVFNNPCSNATLNRDYETSSDNRYWLPAYAETAGNGSVVDAAFIRCGGTSYSLPQLQQLGSAFPAQLAHTEQGSTVSAGPLQYPYWRHLGPEWLGLQDTRCPVPSSPEPAAE